jgi:cytosine/uracil/thiamine/allantoin permease
MRFHADNNIQAGMNWRAAVVQIFFGALCLPGLINSIDPSIRIPVGFYRIYALNWFVNTFGAVIAYWLLYKFFPDKTSLVSATISGVIDGASAEDLEATDGTDKKGAT